MTLFLHMSERNVVYVKDDTVIEAGSDVPAGFRAVEGENGMSDALRSG